MWNCYVVNNLRKSGLSLNPQNVSGGTFPQKDRQEENNKWKIFFPYTGGVAEKLRRIFNSIPVPLKLKLPSFRRYDTYDTTYSISHLKYGPDILN